MTLLDKLELLDTRIRIPQHPTLPYPPLNSIQLSSVEHTTSKKTDMLYQLRLNLGISFVANYDTLAEAKHYAARELNYYIYEDIKKELYNIRSGSAMGDVKAVFEACNRIENDIINVVDHRTI